MMSGHITARILEKYGITHATVGQVQKGYRNESHPVFMHDGTVRNLLIFKNESQILTRITRADQASKALALRGLPVRERHDPRLLRVKDGVYAGLYTYLPGATVPWEAFTKKHMKLLGWAMADMHAIWRVSEPSDGRQVQSELLPLIDRMQRYFDQADVRKAMGQKLGVQLLVSPGNYAQLVTKVSTLDGQHTVHMDMVRGNVLFGVAQPSEHWQIDGMALTGVIDFEKAAIGHPLFDLARTMAFLLVDSPKPRAKIDKYFLDSGYHKRGGAVLPDPRLLEPLIRLFLLHDFYKFLRHTPYESLADNYHYLRTRELLKTYGMISAKT